MKSPKITLGVLFGLASGAGLMYWLDPKSGRRRRGLATDRARHWGLKLSRGAARGLKDVKHRAQGLMAEAQHSAMEIASDDIVVARVRAQLGRLVSHPKSITVSAMDGRVTLGGPILASEVGRVLRRIATVRGVKGIENFLQPHRSAENVPGLQGDGGLHYRNRANWTPSLRFGSTMVGLGMMAVGFRRSTHAGRLLGMAGIGLVTRSLSNLSFGQFTGIGAGEETVSLQKTIHVDAPLDEVFQFWAGFQNFPRFMKNVHEVTPLDARTSHWVVEGPAGVPVQWDAEITECVHNQVIAWHTMEGATVRHSGRVRFEKCGDGTRIQVQLGYHPPGGALGHGVASFFGVDPKHQLEEDLLRMKAHIETKQPSDDVAA